MAHKSAFSCFILVTLKYQTVKYFVKIIQQSELFELFRVFYFLF